MFSVVIFLFFLSLSPSPSHSFSSGKPLVPQTPTEAWNSLLKVRAAKPLGEIPEMSIPHSKNVLFRAPRNYSIVLFVTTSENQCQPCGMVEKPLKRIASLLKPDTEGNNPVFIYKIDISKEKNREIIQQLQIQHLPSVVHLGPSRDGVQIHPEDQYRLSHTTLSTAHFVNWINERANTNIYIPQPSWMFIVSILGSPNTITTGVCVIGLTILTGIIFHFQNPKNSPLKSPLTWFFVSLICYFLNQAGVIWDIIRAPPAIGIDHNSDEPHLIAHGNNQQFVFEGFLVGFVNSMTAVGVISLAVITPRIKNQWGQTLFFFVMFSVVCVCFYAISKLYCIKHPYYPYCIRF